MRAAPRQRRQAPGYLDFLSGLGFSQDPADYPIVDITDDGIGNGTVDSGDPTLHVFGQTDNPSRLVYIHNCTQATDGRGTNGHGHINVSIAGGFDDRTGFPFRDPNDFQRGLGVNPFGRFAGTRIFAPSFSLSQCGGSYQGLIASSYQSGARISSNSWGCSGCGSYGIRDQSYDTGTRDADSVEPGNQQLTFVFSAGNSGPAVGSIGSPASAKNTIAVGSSEIYRPEDEDGVWNDGCGVSSTSANHVMDVRSSSSRGPASGGRAKPEVIAPGTHVQGTASTAPDYDGYFVCDPYRPSGQSVFAASSGTSHSAPSVAGAASLIYYWVESGQAGTRADGDPDGPPSPALVKAYLMAHPTYLTGNGADDDLPSSAQGYGIPNLELAFEDTERFLVDQSVVLDESGDDVVFELTVAEPGKPVRVALAYTDQAGAAGTMPQVNDLNLRVVADDVEYLGNVFSGQWSTTGGVADAANNYEAVFLPAGTAESLEVTVTGFAIAGDGVPGQGDDTDQDFALVCYNCALLPTFRLVPSPVQQIVCAPQDVEVLIDLRQISGFADPITLSLAGHPAGTTPNFDPNPGLPASSSTLVLGNTAVASAGQYTLEVMGASGALTKTGSVELDLSTEVPGAIETIFPVPAGRDVTELPTLEWSPVSGATSYSVELATDSSFSNVVASATGLADTHFTPGELDLDGVYYWRVTAHNVCGDSYSSVSRFRVRPEVGRCAADRKQIDLLLASYETGSPGWTTGGLEDSWALTDVRAHSGAQAFRAEDTDGESDQFLLSPSIKLPNGDDSLSLHFWNYQSIEAGTTRCFDGAVIEVSVDDGASWSDLVDELLTDPYDFAVSETFDNPLAGELAWCGDPQEWLESIVRLDAYAGETVRFRFRLATDRSVGREGWYVDDVRVQTCTEDPIFGDGFESGDTLAWSSTR